MKSRDNQVFAVAGRQKTLMWNALVATGVGSRESEPCLWSRVPAAQYARNEVGREGAALCLKRAIVAAATPDPPSLP
jgi:hypothetical protein